MKKVLMPLAPGFEEIEALAVVDILRRAGAEVVVAGTVEGVIAGRSSIRVAPDALLDNVKHEKYEMLVVPGGMPGTKHLREDERVLDIVRRMSEEGAYVTAICAAPTVLKAAGVTEGKRLTAHPSVSGDFPPECFSEERVVVDGKVITSRGPGTAIEFALKLTEALFGAEKAVEVNAGVMARV